MQIVVGHAVPDANTGIQNFFWGRILLPYAVYFISVLLAKILFSSLNRKVISVWNIVGIFFGNSPYGNMWLLWTLFVISVIVILIPHTSHFPASVIAISLVIYFFQDVSYGAIDIGIGKICNMLIWFSVGTIIGKNVED